MNVCGVCVCVCVCVCVINTVDLEEDLGERHDLAAKEPGVLAAIVSNFSIWWESIQQSIERESKCPTNPSVPVH